jgi:Protein of unknown function (DUF1579)
MRHCKIAILIMAMCTFGVAQDKTADKKPAGKSAMAHDKDKSPAAAMPQPKPAPEMEPVLKTVGNWSATITNEPSPWSPKGSVDKGSMSVTKGPGGLSVVQDFRSKGAMGAYQGHGIIYWDNLAKKQKSLWCDNMSGCSEGVATTEGDKKWSTEMMSEFQGKKMKTISKGTVADDGNSMHEEFLQSADGGPEKKIMTIDYKRAGKAMAAKPAAAKE